MEEWARKVSNSAVDTGETIAAFSRGGNYPILGGGDVPRSCPKTDLKF